MTVAASRRIIPAVVLIAAAVIGWIAYTALKDRDGTDGQGRAARPAPVEVAPIARGPITLNRTFSGELEALAEFVVAPKVSGRVERVLVNIADAVAFACAPASDAAADDSFGESVAIDGERILVSFRDRMLRWWHPENNS